MTKRSYVRIVSYIAVILIILIAAIMINTKNARNYKAQLELSYQQSLTELSECLDTVNTDLTKSLYSNSSGEIYDLSRDLFAQCSTAKNAMSRLPVSQMELSNTYKFLSQASDYAQYIGTKIDHGESINQEEHQALRSLLKYSEKFNTAAKEMVELVEAGGKITDYEVKSANEINVSSLSNSFSVSAETFEDFPTLLYDGPFSDQVLNKKSTLISSSGVKSKKECAQIAATALNISTAKLNYETDDKSKLPCHTYKSGRYTVMVTKQGGYVKSILYSGSVRDTNITEKNARNIAIEYLDKIGYKNMTESYYYTADNVCTINCAYTKNGVTYYSDLIKIGISLNDGNVVSLDSTTYLVNHTDRAPYKSGITVKEAKKKVSPYLTIESSKKCVIPKESGAEADCFEFTCTSKETGEKALVYINSVTGEEEDIMLLLSTDNGTLVK